MKRHDDSKTTRQEHRRSQFDSDGKNHNAKQRDTGRAEKKLNIGPVVHAMSNDELNGAPGERGARALAIATVRIDG